MLCSRECCVAGNAEKEGLAACVSLGVLQPLDISQRKELTIIASGPTWLVAAVQSTLTTPTYNMSGKGKTSKGAKRSKKLQGTTAAGTSRGGIRRLARRGGVKRIAGSIYEEVRTVLRSFLERVVVGAVAYTEYAKRKTVTAGDVVYSLRKQGRTLYGY